MSGVVVCGIACSSSRGGLPDPAPSRVEKGSVELALVTPDGVSIPEITYRVVDSNGETVERAEVAVGAQETFTFFLRLPEGAQYELLLEAVGQWEGESIPCEGRARFNILDGAVTQVALDVTCTADGRALQSEVGGAQVTANVTLEDDSDCGITQLSVGPLVAYAGDPISVRGVAQPASAIFEWATTGGLVGSFDLLDDDPTGGTFFCSQGQGEVLLRIRNGECEAEASVPVACAVPSVCGDGNLDRGEECDDGNTVEGDGCGPGCSAERCGDGIVQRGESCDDGNADPGDGCSSTCAHEVCGNGTLEGGEQCDDGNLTEGDGCGRNCTIESCGDGIVQAALGEQCDDGNREVGDGCSLACLFEDGDEDGVVDLLDACQDTDTTPVGADGCSLEQRCPCDDDWQSNAQYLSCVSNVLDAMFAAELVDADERASLQLVAAELGCGE